MKLEIARRGKSGISTRHNACFIASPGNMRYHSNVHEKRMRLSIVKHPEAADKDGEKELCQSSQRSRHALTTVVRFGN